MALGHVYTSGAVQYTGSNGAAIDTEVSPYVDFSIVSESGGTLVWNSSGGGNQTIGIGDWIVYSLDSITYMSNTQFTRERMCLPLCSDLNNLKSSVNNAFVRSMGVAAVPTLLASGTATVAVQLQPAMPDGSYAAYASKFAGVSITDLQINSVTVIDADTVNVAVENVGLTTLDGASVMVHAID